MSKMKTLEDLLEHQLQDLHSAESQIIDALPKMIEKVSDADLKKALKDHLEETKEHKRRVEDACGMLDMDFEGEKCKAIAGIIKEAESFMEEDATAEVMDAGIIANAQRVEHYEIAGYGTVCSFAEKLGHTKAKEILGQTLEEEKNADSKLSTIASSEINKMAQV